MNRIRFLRPAAAALAIALMAGPPALAQTEIVAPPNPEADVLASEMRMLAQNPRDLRALLSAAQISTRLNDTSAALAFYARAEKIDPENPRIMAGRAQALVRLERPGEALRLFQTAEQRGLPMGDYLSDRGFAYDLIGTPQLAQRDYKAALQRGGDDETVRRYALSLGITGNYSEAMRVLDPLLRRSDRAAWRARAFILAMSGDFAGAEKIASSMMPGNMGLALTPFFRRLPALSVADKAFAVHFGQLSPTQARRLDAQAAPRLPAYVPERAPPVEVAVIPARPVSTPAPAQSKARRTRRDRGREQQDIAATTSAAIRGMPRIAASNPLPPPPQFQPERLATVQATPAPIPAPVADQLGEPVRPVAAAPTPAPTQPPVRLAAATPAPPLSAAAETNYDLAEAPGSRQLAPMTAAAQPRLADPAPPGPAKIGQEDNVLASIVGNITIPAEELEKVSAPDEAKPAPAPVRVAAVEPKPAPPKAEPRPAAATPGKKPEPAKPKVPPEPKRFWVQVGIGANEKLLPNTWAKLVKQAPAAFKGKSGWWTPLRATNRLLTGPFKSAAEAQAFVNALQKADISAYAFTSEAGQKVTKLGAK